MLKYFSVALGVSVSLSVGTPIPPAVPSYLLGAAQRPPVEFAMALLTARVPCGLEIRESEDRPHERPVSKIGPQGDVPLSDVVRAFEAHHRDYRAAVVGGVLVIRPRTDVLPFLDAPSTISTPTPITGVMVALRRVFSPLVPRWGRGGISIGSGGHGSGRELRVVLDGRGGRTVIDTLNQIVLQAPGRAWEVVTRKDGASLRPVTVGFIDADGYRRRHEIGGP